MRILMVAVGAALLICGCGSVGTGSRPTPSPGPGLGFDVVVTEQDRTATVHVGQKLEVVLHAINGMGNWSQPKSSDQSILLPIVNPAATAARGATLAAYEAMATGEADITSYASPLCSPGQACPMYVAVFSLKVTITP